jgi:hypothetical protein
MLAWRAGAGTGTVQRAHDFIFMYVIHHFTACVYMYSYQKQSTYILFRFELTPSIHSIPVIVF